MLRRLLILIFIGFASPLLGQVVIPSLDPVQPTELSSALAWRIGSTVGVESEAFNRDEDASHDTGVENVKSAVLIAYQPGNVVGEIYYSPYRKTLTYDSDYSSIEWTDDDASLLELRLAIRGNRQVSVGIGYGKFEYSPSFYNEKYEESYYEGSFSVRLLDGLFFAGAGMQRFTVNLGSSDTIKYNTLISGVALQMGDPTDVIFKTEAAYKQIPRTESENDVLSTVRKSTVSQFNMELMTGALFASFEYTNKLTEEARGSDDNQNDITSRYGVGLKLGAMTIGLYRNAHKIDYQDDDIEYDTYQATLGISFL